MSEITAIRPGKTGKRVNIFLDGKFAFSLEAKVAAKEGLEVEQVLSTEQVDGLLRSDQFRRCYNAAVRYLSYRPRSEAELRERLQRRGFDGDTQEAVLARLKEQKLVDDATFARFWQENRESFSPRSQWLTRSELKRKGVAGDVIEQAVKAIDDSESAYRAALKKAPGLTDLDYDGFRRRLGGYLRRRGFSYEVINHSIERLWRERGNGSDSRSTQLRAGEEGGE